MNTLTIEMIHDVVCSWCAIGFKHLEGAIEELGVNVNIRYLPHELNPTMDNAGVEISEYFKQTHGWSDQKHDHYREQLIATASEAGVNIDFRYRTHYFNTHLAHRLMAEAEVEELAGKLHRSLLNAYHAQGANISDVAILAELAREVGMSSNAITRALDLEQTSLAYNIAATRRAQFTTPSVPAWVVNEKDLIIGSNSREFFKDYLQNLINKQTQKEA